jgi:hypothetical protein
VNLAIDALQIRSKKTQPEATSRPKMYLRGGRSLDEAVGVQTMVQTNGYRHLGLGIETMAAAPVFQRVNKAQ